MSQAEDVILCTPYSGADLSDSAGSSYSVLEGTHHLEDSDLNGLAMIRPQVFYGVVSPYSYT